MRFSIISIVCVALVSCGGSEQTVTKERVSHGDPLLDKYASNHGYAKSGGVVRSHSDEQSEYAGKRFYGSNDFSGKDYTTNGYATKRWGNNKYAGKTRYAGNTDGSKYQYSPEFVQRQARQGEMVANANGQGFDAASVDRKISRANNARRMEHKQSWYAKRNNVADPVIIPWKEQNKLNPSNDGKMKLSDLSVEDAKVIMGRSDDN